MSLRASQPTQRLYFGLWPHDEARQALSLHVRWAATASFLVLLLAVWRGAGYRQEARPSRLFLAVLMVASAALIATAYRGGINVYHFGIGVSR